MNGMTDRMIQVCHALSEAPLSGPFGRDSLLSDLEGRGLTLVRVERPEAKGVVLLFAALEGPEVASLDVNARARTRARHSLMCSRGFWPPPNSLNGPR